MSPGRDDLCDICFGLLGMALFMMVLAFLAGLAVGVFAL